MITTTQDATFTDPSLARVDQAEQAAVAKPKVKADLSAADLIRQFEKDNIVPKYEADVLGRMTPEREYIHTEANFATTVGGVSTNYLYKFQQVHKAQINARDPQVAVREKKRLPLEDPLTGQSLEDPATKKMLTAFSKTMEMLIQHYLSPDEIGIKAILDGVIQDVDTVGIVYLKLDWLEDMNRDPVGATRPQDFQATMARMKRMLAAQARGECKEGDAMYAEMKDCADTIRRQQEGEFWRKMAFGAGQMPNGEDPRKVRWETDLPTEPQLVELPKYRGFVLRQIMPEDVRRDYSIFRPEEFKRSRHFTYRVKMTQDKIREFYNKADDEDLLAGATAVTSSENVRSKNSEMQDPAARPNLESGAANGELVVWVRMDRAANKIYHWIEGTDTWLREPETPEVSTSNWFNVWPVLFNRASGRLLPISNTTLGKPLQEEINTVRTHKRQAKRAAYDRFIFQQGLFTDDEQKALRSAPPGSFTPTSKTKDELDKLIYRMPGQYNELVHNVIEERQELGSVLNQSQASQGMTKGGSDSATEAAIANQTSDSVTAEHKGVLEALIRDIGVAIGEILTQALPEENAKAICGPGAYWPMADREQIWSHLMVEVEAGSTGMPDQQKRLDGLKSAVDIGTAMGLGTVPGGPTWNAVNGMKKLAEIMDWREEPETLVSFPALPPLPTGMPTGGPPSAGAPQGGGPQIPGGVPPAAEMQQEQNAGNTAPPTLPMVNSAPVPPGMG